MKICINDQTIVTQSQIRNLIVAFLNNQATALDCYQCASQNEWKCMDGELLESSVVPANCSHVYGARYCVKSVGRYGGVYINVLSLYVCMYSCFSFFFLCSMLRYFKRLISMFLFA